MFDKKECTSCQYNYDDHLDECPKCRTKNDSFIDLKHCQKMLWTNPFFEIGGFLLGWGGLQLFALILSYIFPSTMDSIARSAFINLTTYLFLIVGLLGLFFPYLKKIAKCFTKFRPLIAGIIYAALLIGLSICWGLIAKAINPTAPIGENETRIREIVRNYPAVGFFFIVLLAPICEELTYRVGLFSFFHRINRYLAYGIGSIVFGLIHMQYFGTNLAVEFLSFPTYVISGALLCFAYEKEGLAASTYAHILNNLVSFITILVIKS